MVNIFHERNYKTLQHDDIQPKEVRTLFHNQSFDDNMNFKYLELVVINIETSIFQKLDISNNDFFV